MPNRVSIVCPACGAEADFDFAVGVLVKRKSDLAYFEKSGTFEVQRIHSHGYKNYAIYWPGLAKQSLSVLSELPEGYSSADWDVNALGWSSFAARLSGEDGVVKCKNCQLCRKHKLSWPSDAKFQINHRGHVLWAFNRESTKVLLEFVESKERDFSKHAWRSMLMKVPRIFLAAKSREPIAKKLRHALNEVQK